MSSFLPYREDDGNVYIYDFENDTRYNIGEIIYGNNIYYRVEKNFESGSSTTLEDEFLAGNISQFNKLDMTGDVTTVGPVDDGTGRRYGNRDVSLIAPNDHFVVGYRLYGVGATNKNDGGNSGSTLRHFMYVKQMKKD